MTRPVVLDPRVAHRGLGGYGYCVDCGSTAPGFCVTKRAEHPRVWAREQRRLSPMTKTAAPTRENQSFRPDGGAA